MISRGRPGDLPERHGTCTFRHVDGSTTTSESYAAADLASADAVIIGADPPPSLCSLAPNPDSYPLIQQSNLCTCRVSIPVRTWWRLHRHSVGLGL